MSAKDDLEFVNEARVAVSRPMQPASTNEKFLVASSGDMNRLLSLAERGARFMPEHEAVIEAALAFSHEEKCNNCCQDWPPGTPCRGCALEAAKARLRALNEASEKENER